MGILRKQEKTNKLKNNFLKIFGFTLSEVLITLVIIGVIAAITVPIINAQHRKAQYASSLYKALSVINQAAKKYYVTYGENPQCGYWAKNPYGGSKCTGRNESGGCTGWTLSDGSPLPSDYNGYFSDCTKLWKSFYENMNTMKICKSQAYEEGCIPKYEGRDTLYASKNPDKSDFDVTVATASQGFSQSQILNGAAIVLTDGSIFFSYIGESARYFAVDVNGQKGPNKWGVDVHVLMPKVRHQYDAPVFYSNNSLIEKGGMSSNKILYRN